MTKRYIACFYSEKGCLNVRNHLNNPLPQHIAIIPDGNSRWAKQRFLSPIEGYRAGAKVVESIALQAKTLGIPYITFYLLSLENFNKRSKPWLDGFFDFATDLAQHYIQRDYLKDFRLRFIGDLNRVPEKLKNFIDELSNASQTNEGPTIIIALAYTGKDEIVRATNAFIKDKVLNSHDHSPLTEAVFEEYLDTNGIPEPDLLIRSGGDIRLSGFLLWQLAYTELIFIPEFWPDFTVQHFNWTIDEFCKRTRNYGRERLQYEG